MVEIRNKEDLEKWLEGKPKHWAVALASRSALKSIPNMGADLTELKNVDHWAATIILPVLRATLISASASKFPDADMRDSAFSAVSAVSAAFSAVSADSAAFSAVSAVSAAVSAAFSADSAAFSAVSAASSAAVSAASSAADSAAYSAADSARSDSAAAVWRAISQDCEILQQGEGLWKEPFWHGQKPDHSDLFWADLKRALLEEDSYWQTLTQWYEDRVMGDEVAASAGRRSIREMELEIANLSDEIWSDPKLANEAIKAIQDRYWGNQALEADENIEQEISDLEIPPQKPAAIEPVWVGGIMGLPSSAANANLPPEPLEASLTALKNRLQRLLEDVRDSNVDQRICKYLKSVIDLIPQESPNQISLFELAHELETLQGLSKLVQEQGSKILAEQYGSLLLAFDRTVQQFPDWKQFAQNASTITLTEEELSAIPDLVAEVVEVSRDPEAAELIDEAIPTAFEQLAEKSLLEGGDPAAEYVPEGPWAEFNQSQSIGLIEGVSNFLKAALTPLVEGWEQGKDGKSFRHEVAKSISREAMKGAENTGPILVKVVKKVLGSKLFKAGGSLATAQQLGWLEPFKPLIEKLISLIS